MNLLWGIVLSIFAGMMNGIFPLPMKANKVWAWENNWLPFSILSLGLFPWLIVYRLVPDIHSTFVNISFGDELQAIAWGCLIYTGSLLFGISIDLLGMGLAFSLLIGTMTMVGVLGPWILHGQLRSAGAAFVVAGVAMAVVSVILGTLAASSRDCEQASRGTPRRLGSLGRLLSILGGMLSGFLPIAMSTPCSARIRSAAILYGRSEPSNASNLMLAFILLGGLFTNCGYCLFLLLKKQTYRHYVHREVSVYWLTILLMAVLYSSSNALWAIAGSAQFLGPLGPSVGWALFVGAIVLTSTAAGIFSGEWANAGTRSFYRLGISILALVIGMTLVCLGNYFHLANLKDDEYSLDCRHPAIWYC
jgi:L-rhamnose-H+ transport protein